ncbi:hypothetical protein [Ancylobacter sp.]|uniref:hypothetical protein n=1 Tax=Ancylobacter sp. TaxID=1872567 RepID=UPI003C7B92B6
MTASPIDRETEEALIPLSALQHYLFGPRQCALIHVEQLWAEDVAVDRNSSDAVTVAPRGGVDRNKLLLGQWCLLAGSPPGGGVHRNNFVVGQGIGNGESPPRWAWFETRPSATMRTIRPVAPTRGRGSKRRARYHADA